MDENIPVQLKAIFRGHEVRFVNDITSMDS